jgi:LysM repeat protein
MELVRFNGYSAPPVIHPGDIVKIPCTNTAQQPAPQYWTYTVNQPGESYWAIAEKYLGKGIRWKEIKALNDNKDVIYPGDVLKIPCSNTAPAPEPQYRTHTVKPGESYWSIAEKYLDKGIRWAEIKALNGNKDVIHPGDVLKIPN